MAEAVERGRSDARHDMGRDHIERLGGEPARRPHAREIVGPVNGDSPRIGLAVHPSSIGRFVPGRGHRTKMRKPHRPRKGCAPQRLCPLPRTQGRASLAHHGH